MNKMFNVLLWGQNNEATTNFHVGIFILRMTTGLAFCTVFEKMLPRDGIWGPQEWFITDIANMGFPMPAFFAWLAVSIEFFGGIFLILGLFARPAALLNAGVTFVAAFLHHKGHIDNSGLMAFTFFIMSTTLVFTGAGKFSLDYFIVQKSAKLRQLALVSITFLLMNAIPTQSFANTPLYTSRLQAVNCETDSSEIVHFWIRNNSALPKKVTLITYRPDVEGNNTQVRFFVPLGAIRISLPLDSKIYIASKDQIRTVMGGKRIDKETPFVFVDETLHKRVIKIHAKS